MPHTHDAKDTVQQPSLRLRSSLPLRLPIAQLHDLNPLPAREVQIVSHHLQPLLLADPQPPRNGLGRKTPVADGEVHHAPPPSSRFASSLTLPPGG
ncbi:hypothetical protein PG995_013157 [Apiospora arundinis]